MKLTDLPVDLSSYLTDGRDRVSLDAVVDMPLTVRDWWLRQGNYGEYVVMQIQREDGQICYVLTGASAIVGVLRAIDQAGLHPTPGDDGLDVRIVRRGRRYRFDVD